MNVHELLISVGRNRRLYYQAAPQISDDQYDDLVRSLRKHRKEANIVYRQASRDLSDMSYGLGTIKWPLKERNGEMKA